MAELLLFIENSLNICLTMSCKYDKIYKITIHIREGSVMAKERISAKQKEILDFIKSEIINKGYPPAVREICNL